MKQTTFKTVFFFVLFLSAQAIQADDFSKAPKDKTGNENYTNLDLYYGYKTYFHDFQHRFNTVYNINTSNPVQLVGLGYSGYFTVDGNKNFYGHFGYSQVVPQTLRVNDTIGAKVTGFVFSVAYGTAYVTANKKFTLILYLGFNTGRLRFYGDEQVRQKNPFFSPKIGIQPKLQLGRFNITLIAEAEEDISKRNWRRMLGTNSDKANINGFKQSGVTTMIGVGYRLFKNGKPDHSDKTYE